MNATHPTIEELRQQPRSHPLRTLVEDRHTKTLYVAGYDRYGQIVRLSDSLESPEYTSNPIFSHPFTPDCVWSPNGFRVIRRLT